MRIPVCRNTSTTAQVQNPRCSSALAALPRPERTADGSLDTVDAWIRMVAVNRLTGHSPGFFSVYTLPPNQAASPESQACAGWEMATQSSPRSTIARWVWLT
mgnify:CR=1 FL=1